MTPPLVHAHSWLSDLYILNLHIYKPTGLCMAKFIQPVLLMFFTVRCGAIEYYIKPADNVTCPPPSQTCLTINQYTDPSNNYLQQNNTVFTFLSGKHVMERPMEFNNVENISLQSIKDDDGGYPQLIPRYICSSSEKMLVSYP